MIIIRLDNVLLIKKYKNKKNISTLDLVKLTNLIENYSISELVDNYQHFHNEILGKPSIDPRSDCDDFLLMTDQNIPI